jgi:hypothetical protein
MRRGQNFTGANVGIDLTDLLALRFATRVDKFTFQYTAMLGRVRQLRIGEKTN